MRGEGIPGIEGTSGGDLLSGVGEIGLNRGGNPFVGGGRRDPWMGGWDRPLRGLYSPGCALVLKGARLKSGYVCGNAPVALSSAFSWTAVDGKSGDLLRVVASICS